MDLFDQAQRDAVREGHPVHLRQIRYPTKSSEDLLAQLEAAVSAKKNGFVITSKPLMGLTSAIRLVADGWKELRPDTPFVTVRSDGAMQFKASSFWASLVGQVGLSMASLRDSEALRLGLLRNLTTKALECKSDRLVLVIDRAHSMLTEGLSQMSLLQDDLGGDGIHLIVVLAGYQSLRTIRSSLHSEGRDEPLLRYFANEVSFHGMRDAYDLSYFLESFDRQRFPPGSDWTLSRFYFRDAFDRGWRLAHESPRAWSVLASHVLMSGELAEIEMQYVAEAICALLESVYERGFGALPPDDDTWRRAVESSGLVQSRMLMNQLAVPNKSR